MSIAIWVLSLGVVSFMLALRSMKDYSSPVMPESKKHITHHPVVKEDQVDEKKRGPIHGTIVQL